MTVLVQLFFWFDGTINPPNFISSQNYHLTKITVLMANTLNVQIRQEDNWHVYNIVFRSWMFCLFRSASIHSVNFIDLFVWVFLLSSLLLGSLWLYYYEYDFYFLLWKWKSIDFCIFIFFLANILKNCISSNSFLI